MDPLSIILLFILVASIVLAAMDYRRRRMAHRDLDAIPGPPGLPVLGNLHQVDLKRPHLTLTDWSLVYGPVYRVRFGIGGEMVVACGADCVREALVDRHLAGRPRPFRVGVTSNNYRNVGFGDPTCPEWKPLRNAVRKEIKATDAVGLKKLESVTLDVMEDMALDIVKAGGGGQVAIDAREHLYMATMNIICAFLVGAKYDKSDEEFKLFGRMERLGVQLVASAGGGGAELEAFPWLRHFGHPTYRRMLEFARLRDEVYEKMKIRAEREAADPEAVRAGENPLIWSLLKQVEAGSSFTEDHIKGSFSDVIMGGTASTTNLTYALLNILLHNDDVHARIRAELHQFRKACEATSDPDRPPMLADRGSMPYMQATLLELLRYVTIAPFTVPHMALDDTTLGGHKIPRGTVVTINLWSVHHDVSFWKDPDRFNPSRFIDPTTGTLLSPDHPVRRQMMPFGGGPRRCIGEAFAMSRLFLVVAGILNDFDVQPPLSPPGDRGTALPPQLVSCDPKTYELGIAVYPMDFTARLVPTDTLRRRLSRGRSII